MRRSGLGAFVGCLGRGEVRSSSTVSATAELEPFSCWDVETPRNCAPRYTSCVAVRRADRRRGQGLPIRTARHKTSKGHSELFSFLEEHTEDPMADPRNRAKSRPEHQPAVSRESPSELTAEDISARIAERVADLQRARGEYEEAKLVTQHTMEFEVCR